MLAPPWVGDGAMLLVLVTMPVVCACCYTFYRVSFFGFERSIEEATWEIDWEGPVFAEPLAAEVLIRFRFFKLAVALIPPA